MDSECQRHTRDSQLDTYSQQHQIFYYSNFDLFNHDHSEHQFYQFSLFIDSLSTQLGSVWKNQANALYHPYLTYKQIFISLLQLWLKYHPPVNSIRTPSVNSVSFNPSYTLEFLSNIQKIISQKHPKVVIKPAQTTIKAVCLGFFMTANDTWEQMFKIDTVPNKQKDNLFKANILKGLTATIQKTLKPLMVVTQKISSVFGKKKRKYNQDIDQQMCQNSQKSYQNCYNQFKKTLEIQKHLQRKMSEIQINQLQILSSNKIIQKQSFLQTESPIQPSIIDNIYNYVTCFLNRNPSWQVASNFVTQILQLNQVILEQGKKVKVMRPAQQFYQKLIMVWLMCQQVGQQTTFNTFLSRLKNIFFFNNWHEKYIIPTKYFFQKMKKDWAQIKSQHPQVKGQQILSKFIGKIKGEMKKDWEQKIKLNKPKI